MKHHLLVFSSLLALASCTTAYKSGQTPDDVYYSPARERHVAEQRDEYARIDKKDDRAYRAEEADREDRYLRMKTSYRRYSVLDDADCYCYTRNNYYGYNNYYRSNDWRYYNRFNTIMWNYNPYYYNPYYNSPYYSGHVVGNFKPVYNKPRGANIYTYDNNAYTNPSRTNAKGYNNTPASSDENYRSSGRNAGSFMRDAFGTSKSSNNTTTTSPSTSTNNSSNNSSSGSSSSGSTRASVRKF